MIDKDLNDDQPQEAPDFWNALSDSTAVSHRMQAIIGLSAEQQEVLDDHKRLNAIESLEELRPIGQKAFLKGKAGVYLMGEVLLRVRDICRSSYPENAREVFLSEAREAYSIGESMADKYIRIYQNVWQRLFQDIQDEGWRTETIRHLLDSYSFDQLEILCATARAEHWHYRDGEIILAAGCVGEGHCASEYVDKQSLQGAFKPIAVDHGGMAPSGATPPADSDTAEEEEIEGDADTGVLLPEAVVKEIVRTGHPEQVIRYKQNEDGTKTHYLLVNCGIVHWDDDEVIVQPNDGAFLAAYLRYDEIIDDTGRVQLRNRKVFVFDPHSVDGGGRPITREIELDDSEL